MSDAPNPPPPEGFNIDALVAAIETAGDHIQHRLATTPNAPGLRVTDLATLNAALRIGIRTYLDTATGGDLRARIAGALRAHEIDVDDQGARCVCGGWDDPDDIDEHLADAVMAVVGPELERANHAATALDRLRQLHEREPRYPLAAGIGSGESCLTCEARIQDEDDIHVESGDGDLLCLAKGPTHHVCGHCHDNEGEEMAWPCYTISALNGDPNA